MLGLHHYPAGSSAVTLNTIGDFNRLTIKNMHRTLCMRCVALQLDCMHSMACKPTHRYVEEGSIFVNHSVASLDQNRFSVGLLHRVEGIVCFLGRYIRGVREASLADLLVSDGRGIGVQRSVNLCNLVHRNGRHCVCCSCATNRCW